MSKNIGSRNSQTNVYWTNKNDIQIICGCFDGNLIDFEKSVKDTHKNNSEYLKQYMELIDIIKYLLNK